MNDYTDLFYTLFAVVIFAVFLLVANNVIVRNEVSKVDLEYEKTAISMAQSIIEEARTMTFDQALLDGVDQGDLPGGFRETLGAPAGMQRRDFTVFDHFHGYTDTLSTQIGDYVVDAEVVYVDGEHPHDEVSDPTFHKKLTVVVRSLESRKGATKTYIKSQF